MYGHKNVQRIALFVILISPISAAYSQESQYQIGLLGNELLGDGVPVNDILGFGVVEC